MTVKRKPLTIQLHLKNDADILERVRSIPDGTRNERLKGVLRAGFMLDAPRVSTSSQSEALEIEVGALRELAEQNAIQMEALKRQNEWLKQALEDLPGYLEGLMSQLTLPSNVSQSAPPIEIEEAPRLSQAELNSRANKMRKASW